MASDRPLAFEERILLFALATGFPGTLFAVLLVWLDPHSLKLRWTVTLVAVFLWGWLAAHLRDRVVRPFQTLANLLAALREGDFSLRARRVPESDALAEVVHEVNAIGEVLREQRLGAVEAAALLHRVVNEVEVAVFAFDEQGGLRLVNRAGERLLASRPTACWDAARRISVWRICSAARSRACRAAPFPAVPGAGRSGAAASANAASPTGCW